MDKRILLIFIIINIFNVYSSPHLTHLMNKRQVFCGSRLADTLALVCDGRYNSPPSKKASMDDVFSYNEYDGLFPIEADDDNQIMYPFLHKEAANSFMPMRFRKSSGVVEECCYKPCTMKHLLLYCA